MTIVPVIVFALLGLAPQDRPAPPASADLSAARALYAAGAYEEALASLSGARLTGASVGEVEQYRALCLLALGRADEATRALDELVTRAPLFKIPEAEVSPRLVTMFHEARKRILPAAARDLYVRAKADFEQQAYAAASTEFDELLVILGDPDLPEADLKALSDLKMLGEGFQKLAAIEVAAAQTRAAAARAAEAAPPPRAAVYSDADKDVKPPVDVVRTMPEWRPANPTEARTRPTGVLRIIIDEEGNVETATLIAPVFASYDPLLLAAARNWRFKPATKNGQPVKFQKLINITLSPR